MVRVAMLVDVVPDAVQNRARDLGWEVIAAGDGTYTVGKAGQRNLRVHSSMTSVENALNRREHSLKQINEKTKLEQIEEAKLAARKTVREGASLRMARGDYLIAAPLDLSWIREKHPTPAVRMCLIEPDVAQNLLDTTNTSNYRALKEAQAARYAGIMRDGHWRITHQGIAFDTGGVLLDGQHRLKACADSGVPIIAMVFVGLDPEIIRHVDEGKGRTAGDIFRHLGLKVSTSLTPTVRLVVAYNSEFPLSAMRAAIPNADVVAFAEKNPEIVRCASRASGLSKGKVGGDGYGSVGKVAVGGMAYLLSEVCKEPEAETIDTFLATVSSGYQYKYGPGKGMNEGRVLLAPNDPRAKLRLWLHTMGRVRIGARVARVNSLTQLALLIEVWNHLCRGERPRRFEPDVENLNYGWPDRPTPALIKALEL